ncbi:MAG: hypothetical protein GY707_18810, partial [Desulfobacteraceae bacterium]|nr:hypothetical protein [Desulfobacteraceae bacterium]
MTYKIIQELVEKLSLEFVLLDSSEPETLSELSPILKEILENSLKLPLETMSDKILEIEKIVELATKAKLSNVEESFETVTSIISEVEEFVHMLINSGPEPNEEDDQDTKFEKAEKSLENLSKLIGSFCPGEIPDLGAMLNTCNDIADKTEFIDSELFHEAASGCRNYLESMTLENIENTKPIEEGIILLKALLTHLKKGV